MTIEILPGGFEQLERALQTLGREINPSARMAINDSARFAVRVGAKAISDDLNLNKRYITGGPTPRLGVSRYAKVEDLEATVTGRDRPTSLARFTKAAPRFGRQATSPTVRVNRAGGNQKVRGSFFVRLRSGKERSADNYNVGLAVRLKPGDTISGKNRMAKAGKNGFYLLYGPSVGQAYRSQARKTAPQITAHLGNQMARQLNRAL